MHEQAGIEEKKQSTNRRQTVTVFGGIAIVAATVVATWPVWKQKTYDFNVACHDGRPPQITTVSYSDDRPAASVTCPEGRPEVTEVDPGTPLSQSGPGYNLTMDTSHTVGWLQSNHLRFSIHDDPQQPLTVDIRVNSSDQVFIDDAYVSSQPLVHGGINYGGSPGSP